MFDNKMIAPLRNKPPNRNDKQDLTLPIILHDFQLNNWELTDLVFR